MPSVSRRKAWACSTVPMTGAASLSRGSNWCSRPRARRTSSRQASCSSSQRCVTSSRSTVSGRWGGLLGRSRRMAAMGTKTLPGSGPSCCCPPPSAAPPRPPCRESPDADRLPERGGSRRAASSLRSRGERRAGPGPRPPSSGSVPRRHRCCGSRRTAAASRSPAGSRCCRSCGRGRRPARAPASRGGTKGSRCTWMWSVALHWICLPARMPPACRLVRPAQNTMKSRPNSAFFRSKPISRPLPAATMTVIEMIPHVIPNMVRAIRLLWAARVSNVSARRSRKDICP